MFEKGFSYPCRVETLKRRIFAAACAVGTLPHIAWWSDRRNTMEADFSRRFEVKPAPLHARSLLRLAGCRGLRRNQQAREILGGHGGG
jgi:hypothetical protein